MATATKTVTARPGQTQAPAFTPAPPASRSMPVMQRLICREWLTALAVADRHDRVLGGYRLAPQFMASVEDRRIATPVPRIGFTCAMVASKLPGLEPHPWREGKSGGGYDPQAVCEDRAKAWMCSLGHGRCAARLFYWLLPDGVIEFDSVRNHEAISRI
jgi:hypothetical protein